MDEENSALENGMAREDGEDEATMTVTIALDSPDEKAENGAAAKEEEWNDAERSLFLCLSSPSSSDLLSPWRSLDSVRTADLPSEIANSLSLRLNPPSCGSMRNWEWLAANLGLEIEEIVRWRQSINPTGSLLRRFGDQPFVKLLELVAEMGRLDVLLSVRQFNSLLTSPSHSIPPRRHQLDSALFHSTTNLSTSTALARSVPSSLPLPEQPFLLILHHEHPGNADLRKLYKLLYRNLQKYAQEEGIKVVDVDKCMNERDLLGSVTSHFEQAREVLMALSPDYAKTIAGSAAGDADDQRVKMKAYLHQMTFNEVLFNGNQNRRFRVVLLEGTLAEHVPRGWPSNTLHYRFPQDFAALCQRLFENNATK